MSTPRPNSLCFGGMTSACEELASRLGPVCATNEMSRTHRRRCLRNSAPSMRALDPLSRIRQMLLLSTPLSRCAAPTAPFQSAFPTDRLLLPELLVTGQSLYSSPCPTQLLQKGIHSQYAQCVEGRNERSDSEPCSASEAAHPDVRAPLL